MPQDPRSDPDSRHLLVSGTPARWCTSQCWLPSRRYLLDRPGTGRSPAGTWAGVDDPGGAEPVRLPSGRHLHPVSGLLTLRCPTGTRAAGSQGRRYGGGRIPSDFPPPDARPHGTAWSGEGRPGTAEAVDRPFAHVSAIVGTKRGCKGTRRGDGAATCKIAGIAYTGSNPVPATLPLSCGNTAV
jgi:hypothetical protein